MWHRVDLLDLQSRSRRPEGALPSAVVALVKIYCQGSIDVERMSSTSLRSWFARKPDCTSCSAGRKSIFFCFLYIRGRKKEKSHQSAGLCQSGGGEQPAGSGRAASLPESRTVERTRVGGGTGAVCAMAAKTAESTLTRSLRALDWSYGELSRLISFSGPPGDSSPSQRNVLAIRACDLPLAACCPPPAARHLRGPLPPSRLRQSASPDEQTPAVHEG